MLHLHTLPRTRIICPMCHLGHLQLRVATYMRQFGETLISAPNTPVFECDVCHHREFDRLTVQRIELLVGQNGAPPNRYKAAEPDANSPSEPVVPPPPKPVRTPKASKSRAKAKA
jgi:YgiT-type zinc finger domain-containing protein